MSNVINRVFALLFILLLIIISAELFSLFFLKPQKAKTPSKSSSNSSPYACPVPKDFCSQGHIIKVDGQAMGMGFQLPINTPIYPVFKGSMRTGGVAYIKQPGGSRFPTLTIVDEANQREVVYTFTGKDYTSAPNNSEEIVLQARKDSIHLP